MHGHVSARSGASADMANPGAQLAAAASALVSALDAFGQPSMVIGGIASIAHGVARLTRDIDATVQGEGTELEALGPR